MPFHLGAFINSDDPDLRENSIKALQLLLMWGGEEAQHACTISGQEASDAKRLDVRTLVTTRLRSIKAELDSPDTDKDQKEMIKANVCNSETRLSLVLQWNDVFLSGGGCGYCRFAYKAQVKHLEELLSHGGPAGPEARCGRLDLLIHVAAGTPKLKILLLSGLLQ